MNFYLNLYMCSTENFNWSWKVYLIQITLKLNFLFLLQVSNDIQEFQIIQCAKTMWTKTWWRWVCFFCFFATVFGLTYSTLTVTCRTLNRTLLLICLSLCEHVYKLLYCIEEEVLMYLNVCVTWGMWFIMKNSVQQNLKRAVHLPPHPVEHALWICNTTSTFWGCEFHPDTHHSQKILVLLRHS